MAGYVFTHDEAKRVASTVKAKEGRPHTRLPPRKRPYRSNGSNGSSGGGTTTGSGVGGAGFSTECCNTIYETGSVDSNSLEWATDYNVTGAGGSIGDFTITDQGSSTWESDAIDVTCNDPVETDEYTATMVVSGGTSAGVPAGGIVLTISMSLGGDGGDSACCDALTTGFVHKYTNTELVVNPLAAFKLRPMQTGTEGQWCENVSCELCIVPTIGSESCGGTEYPAEFFVTLSGAETNASKTDPDCDDCYLLNREWTVPYVSSGTNRLNYEIATGLSATPCNRSQDLVITLNCGALSLEVAITRPTGIDVSWKKTWTTIEDMEADLTTPGEVSIPFFSAEAQDILRNCDHPEEPITLTVPTFTP